VLLLLLIVLMEQNQQQLDLLHVLLALQGYFVKDLTKKHVLIEAIAQLELRDPNYALQVHTTISQQV